MVRIIRCRMLLPPLPRTAVGDAPSRGHGPRAEPPEVHQRAAPADYVGRHRVPLVHLHRGTRPHEPGDDLSTRDAIVQKLTILDEAHQSLLGHGIDPDRRSELHDALDRGATLGELLMALVASDEYVEQLVSELVDERTSDAEFVEEAYRVALRRDPDRDGRRAFLDALGLGASRCDVVRSLVRSDEHVNRVVAGAYRLPNLRALRPDRYRSLVTETGAREQFFRIEDDEDFDWLESSILANDYYDRPGVWGFSLDEDKRAMAGMLANFEPRRALELGCASGPVLQALADLGFEAEGIEISRGAIERAVPEVRPRIHQGDILDLEAEARYDLVFGLDIFEHLNPNRLDTYLERIESILAPHGFVFVNVPTYGHDPVFGTVFDPFVPEWREASERGERFSLLQVDDDGYPMHGHLIWAPPEWWLRRFATHGLYRDVAVESALHDAYDEFFGPRYPARLAFFVLTRQPLGAASRQVVERVRASRAVAGR